MFTATSTSQTLKFGTNVEPGVSDGWTYLGIDDISVRSCLPEPTAGPTAEPTATPTVEPTATPTAEPTATPTAEPTALTEVSTEVPIVACRPLVLFPCTLRYLLRESA